MKSKPPDLRARDARRKVIQRSCSRAQKCHRRAPSPSAHARARPARSHGSARHPRAPPRPPRPLPRPPRPTRRCAPA
eukprot:7391800-Prymnesium_polylepis.3